MDPILFVAIILAFVFPPFLGVCFVLLDESETGNQVFLAVFAMIAVLSHVKIFDSYVVYYLDHESEPDPIKFGIAQLGWLVGSSGLTALVTWGIPKVPDAWHHATHRHQPHH